MDASAGATLTRHAARRPARGFSMVELLVTIVLAGIIFAAMVPLFVNAMKATSHDATTADLANIAQARLSQVGLMNFSDINQTAFPTPAPTTLAGHSQPFMVTTTVTPGTGNGVATKQVTVSVRLQNGTSASKSVSAVFQGGPNGITSTSGIPTDLPTTNLSITASFKNWSEVNSQGVSVQRIETDITPNVTFTPAPTKQSPTSTNQSVTWTGLTGGMAYLYTVTCHSTHGTFTTPSFHLLTSANKYFDTNPGGS